MESSGVRLRKGALFRALGYKPHPAQAVVHASKAPRRLMGCGSRFGKTTVGVYEAVYALLAPGEKRLGWLVSATYDLTQRIFRRVVEIMHEHFPQRILLFEPRAHRIVVANLGGGESELRAKSADRPVSLLGEALDFVIIDEAAKLREDVWTEHVVPRLLDRRGWALLLSTPNGANWFYREYRRGTRKTRDPDYACWSFPTSSNPFISKELIEAEQKRLAQDVFRVQYLAEFLGTELEPCDTCGGPAEGVVNCITLRNDEVARTCPECGNYVHADGSTALPLWNGKIGRTLVFIHQDGPQFASARLEVIEEARPPNAHLTVIHGVDAEGPPPALPEHE